MKQFENQDYIEVSLTVSSSATASWNLIAKTLYVCVCVLCVCVCVRMCMYVCMCVNVRVCVLRMLTQLSMYYCPCTMYMYYYILLSLPTLLEYPLILGTAMEFRANY